MLLDAFAKTFALHSRKTLPKCDNVVGFSAEDKTAYKKVISRPIQKLTYADRREVEEAGAI